jgi:phage head maturation protease
MSVEGEQEEEEMSNMCVQISPSQELKEVSITPKPHCLSLEESE